MDQALLRAAIIDRLFALGQAPAPAPQARPAPPSAAREPDAVEQAVARPRPPTFVALDFETANPQRDSACSVAAVRVEGGRIVERLSRLIRPVPRGLHGDPRQLFHPRLTEIHGIRWADVRGAPCFREVWPEVARLLDGAFVLVAHNAAFDRSVLEVSCRSAGLSPPRIPFLCTVRLARSCWPLSSARLPVVARYLGLSLTHHDPLSDATACAQIACAAYGRRPELFEADYQPAGSSWAASRRHSSATG